MADDSAEAESLENPNPNPSTDERSAPSLPLPPSSSMASLSLGIWPPSQRTREAVTQRLVEMLSSSSSSALTKRYGVLPADEAASAARSIEAAAFAAASAEAAGEDGSASSSIDGGLEVLEKYSKEVSARMLESVKSRNPKPDPGSEPKPAGSEKVEVEEAGSQSSTGAA